MTGLIAVIALAIVVTMQTWQFHMVNQRADELERRVDHMDAYPEKAPESVSSRAGQRYFVEIVGNRAYRFYENGTVVVVPARRTDA